MNPKEYGERMRRNILMLLKENPNEKFSLTDIAIYFNMGYMSTMGYMKQLKDKKLPNLKHGYGYRKMSFYWWVEK